MVLVNSERKKSGVKFLIMDKDFMEAAMQRVASKPAEEIILE